MLTFTDVTLTPDLPFTVQITEQEVVSGSISAAQANESFEIIQNLDFDIPISVSEIEENQLKAYPSPTQGLITLEGKLEGSSIKVLDFSGRLLLAKKAYSNQIQIDLSYFSAGTYMLIVEKGNAITYRSKVLKQ